MSSSPTLPQIDISPFLPSSNSPSSPSSPSPSLQQTQCATQLAQACETHGFFYLTHHSVPETLTTHVLQLAREFFTTSSPEQKNKIRRTDPGVGSKGDGARGYQVVGDNVTQGKRDWHEAIDWYRPVVEGEGEGEEKGEDITASPPRNSTRTEPEPFSQAAQKDNKRRLVPSSPPPTSNTRPQRTPPFPLLHGINLWPDHPTAFRSVYQIYIREMLALGTTVVRAMGHALELDDPETFVKATRESFWVMRAIGYPPLPELEHGHGRRGQEKGNEREDDDAETESQEKENTDPLSCGAHTDYGCLTLLLTDSTKGALQVQHPPSQSASSTTTTTTTTSSSKWLSPPPLPNTFIVNIGDMMTRYTNGLWKSTLHRVVHRGEGYRVSVPFFFEPDFEARVGPLEECVRRGRGMGRGMLGGGGRGGGGDGGGGNGKRMFGEVKYGEHLVGKVKGNFHGGGEEEGDEG